MNDLRQTMTCALLAALLLAAAPARANEIDKLIPGKDPPPVITISKNGLQPVPLKAGPPAVIIQQYPFMRPLIDEVRKMEKMSTKRSDFDGTSTFSTALMKDRDLKANFVFLYIEGPLNCKPGHGCALFVFPNEGQGYKNVMPLYVQTPVKMLKDGKQVALIFRGTRGHAKWPFSNHTFHYAGRYAGAGPLENVPPAKPPAPMSLPVK